MKQHKYITILTIITSLTLIICISAQKLTYKEQIITLQSKLDKYEYYKNQDNQSSIIIQINNLENQLYQANLDKEIAIEKDDPLGILKAEATINRCTQEINQANITLAENKLQLDLETYTKDLELNYETLISKIEIAQNHLNTLESKLKEKQLLLEQEKITQTEILELKTEISKTNLDKLNLTIEAKKIHYLLENQIEQ